MELNEIHTEHEHATTSLKVVLLIFAIVLVGALAYLVWAANTAPDTTDNSAAVTKKTTTEATKTTTSSDKTTLTDTKFGFSITYPKSWSLEKLVGYLETADRATSYVGYVGRKVTYDSSSNTIPDWRITVYEKSTTAKRIGGMKASIQDMGESGIIVTDLTEGTAKIGELSAITLSYKRGGEKSLLYYLTQGSLLFEISTDGSADQMAVAETFKFTEQP